MALVERLMGEPFCPPEAKIPVHLLYASAHEVALGPRTSAQIKAYWVMDASDAAEWDTLAAQVASQTNDTAKLRKLEDFHVVFMLAEMRVTFYTTPAEVRSRLGI